MPRWFYALANTVDRYGMYHTTIRVASPTRINLEEPVRVASPTRINLEEPVRLASPTRINLDEP